MATQAQLDANRRNAQKSTGPTTAEGKARTRRNASRHDLCSGVALMDDEGNEQFLILLADLREEHRPDGPTEEILVYKMAEHFFFSWRASILLAERLNFNDHEDRSHQVSLMLRYHTTADRGFLRNLAELRKLQNERRQMEKDEEQERREIEAAAPAPEEIGSVSQNDPLRPEAPPIPPATRPEIIAHSTCSGPVTVRGTVETRLNRQAKVA